MSVLIRGMEMPKSCSECALRTDWATCGYYSIAKHIPSRDVPEDEYNERRDDCPLSEIPPHGDLIDRNAFVAAQRHLYCDNCDRRRGMKDGKLTKKFAYAIGDAPCRACYIDDVLDSLEDYAPTIIPAEEGET